MRCRTHSIGATASIILFVFDLLWIGDTDLREEPLRERRRLLAELMELVESPLVRFSHDFAEDPRSLIASARTMKLEGIVGKRADSPYRPGRSKDWIKLKSNRRQEFVVSGYSRAKCARSGVHALLLGVFENNGALRYTGSVLPYLSTRREKIFAEQAASLARPKPPFRNPLQSERNREFVWLKPNVVADVSFLEWTRGGELRSPVFRAFREDKPAQAVTEEVPLAVDSIGADSRSNAAARRRYCSA
jgi:bifunctional non-homologous end joining protein LigD